MTDNIDPFGNDNAQLQALMHVIDEITNIPTTLINTPSTLRNRNVRNLEQIISDHHDDPELVHDLKSAVIEIEYLSSIIKDLRGRLHE